MGAPVKAEETESSVSFLTKDPEISQDDNDMKDVTTTSFGLIIAYLLPGLVGLYSFTFWSSPLRSVSHTFLSAQSDLGLSLMVLAAAVVVGLQLNVLRFFFYERVLCRTKRISPQVFVKLNASTRLTAFTTVIEENFRYHQFFGSMTLLLPILYAGLLKYLNSYLAQDFWFFFFTALFIASQAFLIFLLYELKAASAGLKDFLWCYQTIKKWLTKARRKRVQVISRIAIVLVIVIYLTWLWLYQGVSNRTSVSLFTLGFAGLEIATGAAAVVALRRYVERIESILT